MLEIVVFTLSANKSFSLTDYCAKIWRNRAINFTDGLLREYIMHKDQPMRYFIYARKSTDDTSRQLRSIGDQQAELWELAHREGLEVAEVFIEKQSAKKPGRPIFDDMLHRIEQGEAQGILSWAPDRLARNSLDGGRIIDLLDTGMLRDIKFPVYRFENSAAGKLMLGLLFGQSKFYVDKLSEDIRRAIERKAESGIWPSAAPVGYLNDRQK